MQTFIELWSRKPAWTDLSTEARADFMARIAPEIEAVLGAGVELVTAGLADAAADRGADRDLFAVWSAPDLETVRLLERTIAATGWYDYFDQVNVRGASIDLEQLIGTLVTG